MNIVEVPYLDDFIKYMRVYKIASEYTLKNYPIHLRDFFTYTEGKYNVNSITIEKYTLYLLEERKFARTTVNAKLAALRTYFHYLYDNEVINRNIAEKIELLSIEDRAMKKLPSQEKIFKILDNIDDIRDRSLLEAIYTSGIREGEASNLNIEHIDFNNKFITIIKGKGKNGGKTRIVPIGNTALKYLKAYIGSRTSGPLFLNNRGKRLGERSIYNICHKYFNFPPHDLRHCFATHAIAKTGNIKGVSEMLGHSSSQMTERIYTHINIDDLKNIYKNTGMNR